MQDEIDNYLQSDDYFTRRSDALLIPDPSNAEASRYWEGQLRVALKNGGLRFLFDNTESRFHGKGFKMIDVLNRHCHPDSVTNAFTTLLSLFNDVQGDTEYGYVSVQGRHTPPLARHDLHLRVALALL